MVGEDIYPYNPVGVECGRRRLRLYGALDLVVENIEIITNTLCGYCGSNVYRKGPPRSRAPQRWGDRRDEERGGDGETKRPKRLREGETESSGKHEVWRSEADVECSKEA